MTKKSGEQFSKEEAERRMQAALRGARIAGHKELKDIPKKNGESRASQKAIGAAKKPTHREK